MPNTTTAARASSTTASTTAPARRRSSMQTWYPAIAVLSAGQPAVAPPSTGSVAPVTKRASSLRRNATNAAISSGPATRPGGLGAGEGDAVDVRPDPEHLAVQRSVDIAGDQRVDADAVAGVRE